MSGTGLSAGVPDWLRPLAVRAGSITTEDLTRFGPPDEGGRESAVLVLFGSGEAGPDVLLFEKSADLRNHAGQPAFPGGARDADDADAVATALREAHEETGLDPSGVEVIAELPRLFEPSPVWVADAGEVASVHRVPIAELVDPANRVAVRLRNGYLGPGFRVRGLLVWGFTGGLLDRLLDLAGWSLPWEPVDVVDLPVVPR